MDARRCRREFHRLAQWAVGRGLLTRREVGLLSRAGTRKAGYWCGHLRRLRAVVRERQAEQVSPRGERQWI